MIEIATREAGPGSNIISKDLVRKYNAYVEELDYPLVFRRERETQVAFHRHEQIEIVYVVGGQGIQTVNGQNYSCQKGDLLFFNVGDLHSVSSESGGVDTIHILMKPSYLSEVAIESLNALESHPLSISTISASKRRRSYYEAQTSVWIRLLRT